MSHKASDFDDVELSETLEYYNTKKGKVSQSWLWAEDCTTEADRVEAANYYGNETRIWRSMRRILQRMYRAKSHRPDMTHPNIEPKLYYNEGYKQALRDIWQMIPETKGE